MSEYRFNKNKHLHELLVDGNWKNLTGCTTILSVLAKPALIQWAANMAVGYIQDKILSGESVLDNLDRWLLEAKSAHIKKKEKAGDYGTKLHEEISGFIQDGIDNNKGYVFGQSDSKSVQNFIDWAKQNKVRFLATEKNIYSKKLFLGGIVDFICEIDGQVWIGDIKSSKSGIYPENFAQVAGYQLMLQEMSLYPNITGYLILNLKESGEMLEKRNISIEDNIKFFMACLEIYRYQEKLKNNTIK